jgi:hypothetical protein
MIRSTRFAAASLLLLTVLAACSANAASGDGVATLASADPGASAAPSASLSPEDAALAFTDCMRDHGIDMPDASVQTGPGGGVAFTYGGPDGDPDGGAQRDPGEREEFQEAMEACGEFLQAAGNIRGEPDPEMMDRMLEFASCMREHGIDMPDPNANGGIMIERNDDGSVSSGDDTLDPGSAEFQEAQEACQPILGDDLPGGGPRTQSGTGDDSGGSIEIAPEPAKP